MSDSLHLEEMVLVALADIIMQIQFETRYNQLKRLEKDFVSQSRVSKAKKTAVPLSTRNSSFFGFRKETGSLKCTQ